MSSTKSRTTGTAGARGQQRRLARALPVDSCCQCRAQRWLVPLWRSAVPAKPVGPHFFLEWQAGRDRPTPGAPPSAYPAPFGHRSVRQSPALQIPTSAHAALPVGLFSLFMTVIIELESPAGLPKPSKFARGDVHSSP